MSSCLLWIDSKEAKIFTLKGAETTKETLKKHGHEHSTDHADNRHHQEDEKFFHEVTTHLRSMKEILIVGPGLAKNHLETHLKNHHHNDVLKKVVGIESLDQMTEAQLLDHARAFYKKFDQAQ